MQAAHKKRIVVIGSSNMDMVVKSSRLPNPGETILGGEFMMNSGGKGANQAVAASRLGGKVWFVSKVGNDIFGKQLLELYKSDNIHTEYIFRDEIFPTGIALITTDEKGENSIVVASGANANLLPEDIRFVREIIVGSDLLMMQLEIPIETVVLAADMARQAGLKVILNPAPARLLPESLFKMLYLITPNETEAEILSGVKITNLDSAKRAADIIQAKGVENVIITLGSDGALIKEKGQFCKIDAYEVKAVDTTAAGDVFNGALCTFLAEGMTLTEASVFASKASAISVTRLGAQPSIPYRNELDSIQYLRKRLYSKI